MSQLSFFSAGTRPVAPDDLDGLLCGPGQVVRRDAGARVSVVVAAGWRVEALARALDELDLAPEQGPAPGGAVSVRTAFDARLGELGTRWGSGSTKRTPPDLELDGPRLRWWAIAAGRADAQGYVLGLGPQDDEAWSGVGAALARAGLRATLLGPRADGPAYRVTGQRRIARLLELVGDPPAEAPDGAWPDPDTAAAHSDRS